MGKGNDKENFQLEFVKFNPLVKRKYGLTDTQTLVYGYIQTSIENSSKITENKGRGVCYVSSKKIGAMVSKKPGTVDFAVQVLKEKGLFEIRNYYIKKYSRNTRYIYLPGQAPTHKDNDVDFFFMEIGELVEENKRTRAIIGDFLYNKGESIESLVEKIEELFDYETGELLGEEDLRELYRDINEFIN